MEVESARNSEAQEEFSSKKRKIESCNPASQNEIIQQDKSSSSLPRIEMESPSEPSKTSTSDTGVESSAQLEAVMDKLFLLGKALGEARNEIHRLNQLLSNQSPVKQRAALTEQKDGSISPKIATTNVLDSINVGVSRTEKSRGRLYRITKGEYGETKKWEWLKDKIKLEDIADEVSGSKDMPDNKVKFWKAWRLRENGNLVIGTYEEEILNQEI